MMNIGSNIDGAIMLYMWTGASGTDNILLPEKDVAMDTAFPPPEQLNEWN